MSEPKPLFSARLAQDEIYSPAVHETPGSSARCRRPSPRAERAGDA